MTTKTKASVFVIAILALFATILSGIFFFQKQQSGSVDTTDVSSTPEIVMPEGDSEGDFYTSDGVRIHYWYYNRGTSIVTIFLHGGPGGSTFDFRVSGQAEAYANKFGSLLVYDQRGSGNSQRNADLAETINYPRFIQDINDLRSSTIPGQEVIIFGRSFGGPLAIQYANSHPTGVRGYILAAPGPLSMEPKKVTGSSRIPFESMDQELLNKIVLQERELFRQLVDDRGKIDVDSNHSTPSEGDVNVGESFKTFGAYPTQDQYLILPALANTPTLIAFGTYDTQVQPLTVEAMKPYLPNAVFLELPGGHGAAYTHEEEFFAGVQKLFDSIKNNL